MEAMEAMEAKETIVAEKLYTAYRSEVLRGDRAGRGGGGHP